MIKINGKSIDQLDTDDFEIISALVSDKLAAKYESGTMRQIPIYPGQITPVFLEVIAEIATYEPELGT